MNIGISQLAFNDISDIINNIEIFKISGITNIEIIFSKFLNNRDLLSFKNILNKNKISTLSTQSILFNSTINDFLDLNIIPHISNIIEKCNISNTNLLVLGSPTCRKNFIFDELKLIFKTIDKILIKNNKILCIEPNSKIYNGSYFFNIEEIIEFIKRCELKNIKTMIDTHNLINENIDVIECYEKNIKYIYHIHISENKLQSYIPSELHNKLSSSIKKNKYGKLVTYECLPTRDINKHIINFSNRYK